MVRVLTFLLSKCSCRPFQTLASSLSLSVEKAALNADMTRAWLTMTTTQSSKLHPSPGKIKLLLLPSPHHFRLRNRKESTVSDPFPSLMAVLHSRRLPHPAKLMINRMTLTTTGEGNMTTLCRARRLLLAVLRKLLSAVEVLLHLEAELIVAVKATALELPNPALQPRYQVLR